MAKNILVITGSPRKGGNTDLLADAFIEGAASGGANYKKFNVGNMKINGCLACLHCFKNLGHCIQDDDMQKIYPDFEEADMVVFATPIYYYGFTAQLKAFIDRMYAYYKKGYRVKSSALFIVCGDSNPEVLEPAIAEYKGFTGYMHLKDMGIVKATGLNDKGGVASMEQIMEARRIGELSAAE